MKINLIRHKEATLRVTVNLDEGSLIRSLEFTVYIIGIDP